MGGDVSSAANRGGAGGGAPAAEGASALRPREALRKTLIHVARRAPGAGGRACASPGGPGRRAFCRHCPCATVAHRSGPAIPPHHRPDPARRQAPRRSHSRSGSAGRKRARGRAPTAPPLTCAAQIASGRGGRRKPTDRSARANSGACGTARSALLEMLDSCYDQTIRRQTTCRRAVFP